MLASKKRHYEVIRVAVTLLFMLKSIQESTAEGSTEEFIKAGLVTHNLYRARHLETGPLEIDPDLNEKAAKCAQYYMHKGEIDHSCTEKGDAGENLYYGSRVEASTPKDDVEAAKEAVMVWYNEIHDYDFKKNSEKDGKDVTDVGHFTQLVWKETTKLGMGRATAGGNTTVVSLYYTFGNIFVEGKNPMQKFHENVRPLKADFKDFRQVGLYEHNDLRDLHKETGRLVLDGELNVKAQKCAEYYLSIGKIDRTCPHKGEPREVGENLYMHSVRNKPLPDNITAVAIAVMAWYDEIIDYDFSKAKWKDGSEFNDVRQFTQLVWKDTKMLGVGYASQMIDKNGTSVVVCLYSPTGNIFSTKQKPGKNFVINVRILKDGYDETSAADISTPGKSLKEQLLFILAMTSTVLIAGRNFVSNF